MFSNLLLLAFQPPPEFNFDPGPAGPGDAAAAAAGVGFMMFCVVIFLVIAFIPAIIMIAGMWKMFEKAGKPGWAAIVPIYNNYVLTEIAGMDVMWFILTLVPCVGVVAAVMILINVAKNFGKDTGYAIGMILLPFIFIPMLGFGNARYTPMKH
jgi:hypothetical protein